MLKTRDFYLMKVYDVSGKYIGVIDDVCLDFYNSHINGFLISSISFLKKHNYIDSKNVVSIEECMIIKGPLEIFNGLRFKEIKYMDIVDKCNTMIGVLEELIIEKNTFNIKGIIISSGVFDKMIKGKEILVAKSCILCERYIIYIGSNTVKVKTLPHNMGGCKNVDKKKE